ncbi:type IV pili methyl-accepting chemotaxis transducer N-terminal domain-containing protein [Hydrogenophaga sp. BPS33]|uniref:type IV pili methyl-accepting chemotaxis transducer N-terminal domain-containing protein n=1 Tax=Hydrogenophaga sp. BPS33 TaxID=2651974 RepID=UPI0013204340|nr:type IV pili methyl-accepting chemotaxis transducer N-terminal domain-containing protein [Hydrogenophaga sp. BPS33]QHE85426.1 ANTAR domain-containing protein [Hydrogenophaga sp. BPS33]
MTSALVFRSGAAAVLPLAQDLQAIGIEVLAQEDGCSKLVQAAVRHAPDVVIGEVSTPGDGLFKATQALADTAPCPVIVFTADIDAGRIEQAVGAGIHAYVVQGYGAQRLRPLIHLAQARFRQEQALQAQLRDVSQRFEERKSVERAKGILMRARQLTDDEAFQVLRTASMHSNQRLGQVSEHIIQSAHFAEGVNRAGQLRMLSQRVVKLYLLRLAEVQARTQDALLDASIQRVDANIAQLDKTLSAATFGDLLAQVVATWQRLKPALKGKPAAGQLATVDALAERLLQEAERLTSGLESAGAAPPLKVLNVAGRQRMLSQRFAKGALMALLEPATPTGEAAMTLAQREFEAGLALLQGLPLSTPEIRQTLDAAAREWALLVAGATHLQRPAGRDRLLRLEGLASASENLLEGFEQLSAHYERSMQMLMG